MDSGWTFTACGVQLAQRGGGPVYIPGIKDLILVPTRFERLGLLHQGVRFNSLVPNIYSVALVDASNGGNGDL